ncbi:MAG: DNA-binding protein WhiA [Clostridia bacterium]|nr:DNA-binding protein WhiA [Clostridia bacterium]
MSFSSDIKDEICKNEKLSSCCLKAQIAGILMYSKSFSVSRIVFSGEHRPSAQLAAGRLAELFGVISDISAPLEGKSKKVLYTLTVPDMNDRSKLVHYFSDIKKTVKKPCCMSAFVSGTFLACGTANDPAKSYRLEFDIPVKADALFLQKLLLKMDISCRMSERGGRYVIYLNEREAIIDLLAYIGAVNQYWKLLNTAVEKDYRNRATRTANCDNANINRIVDAAAAQISAIKKLKKAGVLENLSDSLRQTAELRLDNPEASLRELCELAGGSVTRSSMNRRLSKLCELAGQLQ